MKARSWRPKTARGYANIFATITGDVWPVNAGHVMAWLNTTRTNDTSVWSYFAHLRTFFNFLQITGVIEEAANPVHQIMRLRLLPTRPRAAGLQPNHIHALRHTSALLAIEAGVSLEKIRDQLGHSDIATTALYLRGRDPARARAYRGFEVGD